MLNDLTKKLLAEGWTRENYPHETVFLKNFENFGWRWDVSKEMVWETPCGLLVEGRTAACSDLTYDGVWYCIENGNPLHRCPYEKHNCEHQPAQLNKWCMCVLHRTERPFTEEESADRVLNERLKKAHEAYFHMTGGQYCACVIEGTGYEPGDYRVAYDPAVCARVHCKNEVCSVTKQKRDLRPANVVYDVVRETITRRGIIEDRKVAVEKGVKVFDRPIAKTDADRWLARKRHEYDPLLSKDIISPRLDAEDRRMEWFSEHHRRWPGYDYFEFHYRTENVRVEVGKPQRDLLKDLQDVAEGIEVVHASDRIREKKEAKQAAKQKRLEEKEKQKRKKMLAAFDRSWEDERYRRTFIHTFGLEEYEKMVQQKKDEQAGVGENLSLFADEEENT